MKRAIRRLVSLLRWPRMNLLADQNVCEILLLVTPAFDVRLYATKVEPEIGGEGVGKIVQRGIEVLLQFGKQYGVTVSGTLQ